MAYRSSNFNRDLYEIREQNDSHSSVHLSEKTNYKGDYERNELITRDKQEESISELYEEERRSNSSFAQNVP